MSRAWPVGRLDPQATLAQNARRILAVRIGELYSYAPIVEDHTATTALHDMRIAAKRLRYTLELFRVVFGEPGERCIERVKALQEELGTLHDHDVRIELIEQELAELAIEQSAALNAALASAEGATHQSITAAALKPPPDDPRRGLLALLGRQHASRRATHTRIVELWRTFNAEGLRRDLVDLSSSPFATVKAPMRPDEVDASMGSANDPAV